MVGWSRAGGGGGGGCGGSDGVSCDSGKRCHSYQSKKVCKKRKKKKPAVVPRMRRDGKREPGGCFVLGQYTCKQ